MNTFFMQNEVTIDQPISDELLSNDNVIYDIDENGNAQTTTFSPNVSRDESRISRAKTRLKRGSMKELIEINTTNYNNKYPIACTLDFSPLNIANYDLLPQIRPEIDFPQFRFGFFHWIHASRNKTVIFDDFKERKRIYRVINGYEPKIDDSTESISDYTATFFPNKPEIVDTSFYKLWEILHYYDVCKGADFVSVHLAGKNLASFIQATMLFRQTYGENKKDKYYGFCVYSEATKNKPFIAHHLANKGPVYLYNNAKSIGDTIDSTFITSAKKFVESSANLITACVKWKNTVVQEQEAAKLILGQIITALHLQKKGGCLILMMFENFTLVSIKMLVMLHYFYESVSIIKPLASRESYPDRYIVCQTFKGCNMLAEYFTLLNNIKGDQYLIDLMPQMELPLEVTTKITAINTQLTNRQFKVINKMIDFIEAKNFYGEVYQQYRERQLTLAKHWAKHFLTDVAHDTKLLQQGYDEHAKVYKNLILVPNMQQHKHAAVESKAVSKAVLKAATKKSAPKKKKTTK